MEDSNGGNFLVKMGKHFALIPFECSEGWGRNVVFIADISWSRTSAASWSSTEIAATVLAEGPEPKDKSKKKLIPHHYETWLYNLSLNFQTKFQKTLASFSEGWAVLDFSVELDGSSMGESSTATTSIVAISAVANVVRGTWEKIPIKKSKEKDEQNQQN